jgi:hypothetical protein
MAAIDYSGLGYRIEIYPCGLALVEMSAYTIKWLLQLTW